MAYINVIEYPECGSEDILMGDEKPDDKRGISHLMVIVNRSLKLIIT